MPRKKQTLPDHTKTYPFQVRMWMDGKDTQLGPHWMEECRCEFASQAKRIARALAMTLGTITVVVDGCGEYIAHCPNLETFARVMREAEAAKVKVQETKEPDAP